MTEDIELERADGAKEGNGGGISFELIFLSDPFLEELIEASAETLLHGAGGAVDEGKALRWKAWNLVEESAWLFGKGIADLQIVISHQTDDIAWPGVVDSFAFTSKEALGVGET